MGSHKKQSYKKWSQTGSQTPQIKLYSQWQKAEIQMLVKLVGCAVVWENQEMV